MRFVKSNETVIAVIGLGYVGLPLAVEFGKSFKVIGFDVNDVRINNLRRGVDVTREVSGEELASASGLSFTSDRRALEEANVYIVTVPTPIDHAKRPDLTSLMRASETVGEVLAPGDIVIYESTVYPGATEEECVPVLERVSGMILNEGFYCGYSPERINPGDRQHRLTTIKKVTSGSTPEVADFIDEIYSSIVTAGTHRAPSIRVAEAAKVIENTQRDLNIALMNELAIIFSKLELDTDAVLEAAGTKWNFLPFRPGLVGGHCIGVDPYYLTYKAEAVGYHPQVILAGRRMNDGMGAYVANTLVRSMIKQKIEVGGARVLIMGLTFKENCPDLRNSRVIDVIRELNDYGIVPDIYDPWADPAEALREHEVSLLSSLNDGEYDAILLAVPHREFVELGHQAIRGYGKMRHIFFDMKSVFLETESDFRL